jgi:translation initiation factor IF-2
VLREKEVEEKRKHDEEVLKQQQEVVKARAVIGPVQVGKIDLNPKKAAAVQRQLIQLPKFRLSLPRKHRKKLEKPVVKKRFRKSCC